MAVSHKLCSCNEATLISLNMNTTIIIRYGKFAVLDLLEFDVWNAAKVKFDTVKSGLLDSIMNKQLLEKEM